MKDSVFGTKIREARKALNMSQREVAQKIGIDFTYLSKIESGDMNPPSQDVIRKLASLLRSNFDELMALAGKVPEDLGPILKDKDYLAFLRSSESHKIIKDWVQNSRKEK